MHARRRLPATRHSITHKFKLETNIYITIGLFDDGNPGELFIQIDQEGTALSGIYDCFAIAVSMLLQSGWSVELLKKHFAYTKFEPSGFTGNAEIGRAQSIPDYIFRWMESKEFNEQVERIVNGNYIRDGGEGTSNRITGNIGETDSKEV